MHSSAPPIVAFVPSSPSTEATMAWLGCGANLAQAGFRVLLVDASLDGHVPRLLPQVATPSSEGAPLAELHVNPLARPAMVDLLRALPDHVGRELPRSALALLPATRPGEGARPDLIHDGKPAAMARWCAVADRVRGAQLYDRGFDLTLWLMPSGHTPAGHLFVSSVSDCFVRLRPPPARLNYPSEAADPADFPDAKNVINAYVVRGSLNPPRGTAWHLPSFDADYEGKPLSYLSRASARQGLNGLSSSIRELLADRPHEQKLGFLEAVAAGDSEGASARFAALWAADFPAALELFDTEVAPREGNLLGAIAALRAVQAAPSRRLWDIQHIAGMALQKLSWSRACAESEEILTAYRDILYAVDAGAEVPYPERLRIDAADALLHAARWHHHGGSPWPHLEAEALELLQRSDTGDRRPADCARWAIAAAHHARLSGSAALLGRVRVALGIWAESAPRWHLQTRAIVLGDFAIVGSDRALWVEVKDTCEAMLPVFPRNAYYSGAIACAYLGELDQAFRWLGQLYAVEPARYLDAFRDPDFAPLWQGLGDQNFPLRLSAPSPH